LLEKAYAQLTRLDRKSYSERIPLGAPVGIGLRDRGSASFLGYNDQLGDVHKRLWVVLYDVEASRGWLVDGPSALLHLVRVSLHSHNNSRVGRRQAPLVLVEENENAANAGSHADKAFDTLAKEENKRLLLREDGTETVGSRVLEMISLLKTMSSEQKLFDQTNKLGLNGFRFNDLVERSGSVTRYTQGPHANFRSWINLVKEGNTLERDTLVLFGRNFGEILSPIDAGKLCHWRTVPKDKEYLAASVHDLRRIVIKNDGLTEWPWSLANQAYWSPAKVTFEHSSCVMGCEQGLCEPLQELFRYRKSHPALSTCFESFEKLPQGGAVIFGGVSSEVEIPSGTMSSTSQSEGNSSRKADAVVLGHSLKLKRSPDDLGSTGSRTNPSNLTSETVYSHQVSTRATTPDSFQDFREDHRIGKCVIEPFKDRVLNDSRWYSKSFRREHVFKRARFPVDTTRGS
jgi:hypothetical protein